MAYTNTTYSANIIGSVNMAPGETSWSPVLSGYNTVKIGVHITAAVDRTSNPLPSPPASPSFSGNVMIFPIGLNSIQSTFPTISKVASFSGEICTTIVYFDIVAVANYRIAFQNTNGFRLNTVATLSEAKM